MSAPDLRIVSVDEQRSKIRNTISLEAYGIVYKEIFPYGNADGWLYNISREVKSLYRNGAPDAYFQMLTMSAFQFLQFNKINTMAGQEIRYRDKKWNGPYLGIEHQIGLANYAGTAIMEAHELRCRLLREVPDSSFPRIEAAIKGLRFEVSGGSIKEKSYASPEFVSKKIVERLLDGTPVYEVDIALNSGFRDLNFTGDDASTIDLEDFRNNIIPTVAQITDGIFDARSLLMGYKNLN